MIVYEEGYFMTKRRKKKKRPNTPRHLHLKRSGRIKAAKHWIPKYAGENLVKGYSKHFGVSKLCAVSELETLGYTFSEAYKQKLEDIEISRQRKVKKRNAAKKRRKEEKEQANDFLDEDSDDTFAFIAGYTSGGAPFGLTWEESEEIENHPPMNESAEDEDEIEVENEVEEDNDSSYGYSTTKIDIVDDELPF